MLKSKESFLNISTNNFTVILYSRSCLSQGSRNLMTKREGFIKVQPFCLSVGYSKKDNSVFKALQWLNGDC